MKRKLLAMCGIITCLTLSLAHKEVSAAGTTSITLQHFVINGSMYYQSSSKYTSYLSYGANTWNSYVGNVIKSGESSGRCYCSIYDTYYSGGIAARTIYSTGQMECNTFILDTYGWTEKVKTFAHEFGHTLGCGENNCASYNVMYPIMGINMGSRTLSVNDKASVDLARTYW